jgi:toxin-antitoxin system PIN domain toxin
MKVPDANVLIYATNRSAAPHAVCRRWLEEALGSAEPVGFAWSVLLAFLRISTKAQLFERPLSATEALDVVDSWLAQPAAIVISETQKHSAGLRALLAPLGTGGNLTSDAHLAALAIEHGAELVSCDTDFARFAGLPWRAPAAISGSRS